MKYRAFGKTGFEVSALGLGAMRLPSLPLLPGTVDTKKAIRMIRHAVDSGINYIDTAYIYHLGMSEKVLGMALRDGYREKVHLVTKLPMILVKETADFDRILDEQLARLETDHIDTYLFHAMNDRHFGTVERLGLLAKMEEARAAGKIRFIGFSFHDTWPVFKKIVDHYSWDVTQIQYNYLDTTVQATTQGLEYAAAKGMAVVIMEPLKGGILVNPPGEARRIIRHSGIKKSPVELALRFLWDRPEVSVVLSGMGSDAMVSENCGYADRAGPGCLEGAERAMLGEIVNIFNKTILVPCTGCSYCIPCPFGVNIPENFAILNQSNVPMRSIFDFGIKLVMRGGTYSQLVKDKEKLDRKRPNGAASLCVACGACVPKCPQGIAIPQELVKGHEVLGKKKKASAVFGKE